MDDVQTELHDLRRNGDVLSGFVIYRVGPRAWSQRFAAIDMDDARLAAESEPFRLGIVRTLDARRTWILLSAT